MSKELENNAPVENANPYSSNPLSAMEVKHLNAATVGVEATRAIEEARVKLMIAKSFPRDKARAFEEITKECSRKALAEDAIYSYPRGGQTVSGASIRLAEMLARCWGNIEFGLRELSNKEGQTEYQAYCWDLETNVNSVVNFSVKHERHTSSSVKLLTDPRDIYEVGANQGSRRLRARILAVIPIDIVEYAISKCRETLAGGASEPLEDKMRKLLNAFVPFGITKKHIEQRLGKSLDEIVLDEVADLRGIYTSIKDGITKPSDWFGNVEAVLPENSAAAKMNEEKK